MDRCQPLSRTLSALLLHAPPPWRPAPRLTTGAPSFTRQDVLTDALETSRLLSVPSADPMRAFCAVHLELAIGQAASLGANEQQCESAACEHVDYVNSVFDELLAKVAPDWAEWLFGNGLCQLQGLWDFTQCGNEFVSELALSRAFSTLVVFCSS